MKRVIPLLIFIFLCSKTNAMEFDLYSYRISWNYVHNHYDRVVTLGKRSLKQDAKKSITNYCFAMSLYQLNKTKWKGTLVDQVLKHLKIGLNTTDPKTNMLIKSDTNLLQIIKKKSIEITLSEFAKYPAKSLTRVQTIVAIYGDSVEIYKIFELEKQRINKKLIEAAVPTVKTKPLKTEPPTIVHTVEKMSKNQFIDTVEQYCGVPLNETQKKCLQTAFMYNNVASCLSGNNPEVMQFFYKIGFTSIKNDEVNWCAAFVNFCMEKQGYKHPNTLLARSWLKMGQPVKDPQPGDLVIFWRVKQTGWQGHVGFFIKEDKASNLVYVYGGNQGGTVCLKPFSKNQILGYRRVLPN